jgi:hypothetical protein
MQDRPLSSFSPERAMAMEHRHILEGEKRVARQEMLVKRLAGNGQSHLLCNASQVLTLLREGLTLSRDHLRSLQSHYGDARAITSDKV